MSTPTKQIFFVPFSEGVVEPTIMSKQHIKFLVALGENLATSMVTYTRSNTCILAPTRATDQCGDVEFIAGMLHLESPKYLGELRRAQIAFDATSQIIMNTFRGYYAVIFVNEFHCVELAKYLHKEKLADTYDLVTERINGTNVIVLKQREWSTPDYPEKYQHRSGGAFLFIHIVDFVRRYILILLGMYFLLIVT